MKILMFTNTFTPHVGGVAQSVSSFSGQLRAIGHHVMVVAPTFDGSPEKETDVVRMPAIHHFYNSDFSFPIHFPGRIRKAVKSFQPDVIHSHHPFLLGDTALRTAAVLNVPVLFTHHTQYERYSYHLPGGDNPAMQHFIISLVTGYCNLCDTVISPSSSIREILRERNVTVPIAVIPTGIDIELFRPGDSSAIRQRLGIADNSIVIGHIGRLAREKNLIFLVKAVAAFMINEPRACFLISGDGPEREAIIDILRDYRLQDRLYLLGKLSRNDLYETYRAMNVFVFASQSETQGIVLVEAMASGLPVVAIDGPGTSDIVKDGINGRLLTNQNEKDFAAALAWVASRTDDALTRQARTSAENFSIARTTDQLCDLYQQLCTTPQLHNHKRQYQGSATKRFVREQGEILYNLWHAAEESLHSTTSAGKDKS